MYTIFGIHYTRWAWLFSPLAFFIKPKVYPESFNKTFFEKNFQDKTIVYLLPRMSIWDIIALNKTLQILNLSKVRVEAKPKQFSQSGILALKPRSVPFRSDKRDSFIGDFLRLLRQDPRAKEGKLIFIPSSIFWSRAPERNEKGFLLRSLFPDDGTGNSLQKLFMLILHRGEVNVAFGKHFEAKITDIDSIGVDYARKMKRLFHIEFAKERAAAFGPTLYDRDKINQWILNTPTTQKYIESSENPVKMESKIAHYIGEIGANYNYVTIRAYEKLFDFLWNQVFEGVRVRNFESIERVAKDGQIVWMPSHRSHFDYMLLSYVLFKKGLVIPHVAAGINLNFWPIGSFLRRGGAFFIRRSFSGNKTYAHALSEYINFLLQNSFPIEFFQEGGRSRIGKLLPPKIGLLSICVQSMIRRKAENTYFVPVYFGYDKVMEDDSYTKELRGAKKQKENAFQFLNGIFKVFTNYGSVDVSFGEPLKIADIWEEYSESFARETGSHALSEDLLPKKFTDIPDSSDSRDPRVQEFVKYLAKRINQRINCAATASGSALLATALLSLKNGATEVSELQFHVMLLHYFVNEFAKLTQWRIATNQNEPHIFEYLQNYLGKKAEEKIDFEKIEALADNYIKIGQRWEMINKQEENNKITFSKNHNKELNLWWYRGTIFHILAPFGMIATILSHPQQTEVSLEKLEFYISQIRNLWQDELFWDQKISNRDIVRICLEILTNLDLTSTDENGFVTVVNQVTKRQVLQFISQLVRPEIELYGIQAASSMMLVKQKGSFSREELISKAISVHANAFLNSFTCQPQIFSKVFGNRIADGFYKSGIFIPGENQRLSLKTTALTSLESFLDLRLWGEFE